MEFEEMQKIWIASRQETVYAINEKALHNIIGSKRTKALHIANLSEWLLILVNFATAAFITVLSFLNSKTNIMMYVMAAWLFITAIYVLVCRVRRIQKQQQFDRSILQDLNYALSTASYQVRLSHIMRLNTLPIALFCILSLSNSAVSYWYIIGAGIFFTASYYFSGWEHNYYKSKKHELEILQHKLENE